MATSDDEERLLILRARARLLAQEEESEVTASADHLDVVQFVVAGQHYALDGNLVREVSPCRHLTHIPCAPPFIAGVVNVRSEIIPVLDTRNLFSLPEGRPVNSKLVILQSDEARLGLLVDDVVGVNTLSMASLKAPLATMPKEQTRYMLGLAAGAVIVIDALLLMNDPQIVVNETVD
jgi:purine-binding chemotaxis protein CheW